MSMEDISLPTDYGLAPVQVVRQDGRVQLNLFFPAHGGAGLFVLFPEDEYEQAEAALLALVARGPLDPDRNLGSEVTGALAAGTMPRPTFSIQSKDFVLGQPSIALRQPDATN